MNTRGVLPGMIAIVAVCGTGCASITQGTEVNVGQHPNVLEKEITRTIRVNYLLYLPEQYAKSRKAWPLMLFLHGKGECGSDVSKLESHGLPKLIAKEKRAFPFVIVSPQCPEGDWWSSQSQLEALNALLDDVVSRYCIDTRRVYVTGLSMGGFGTWSLAAAYPGRFAAIAPICGGGNPKDAARIAHLPVWVFHGAKDTVVPIKNSEEMVAALKKAGGDVTFTVYPDTGHDSWSETYSNPDLYEWFLQHSRSSEE